MLETVYKLISTPEICWANVGYDGPTLCQHSAYYLQTQASSMQQGQLKFKADTEGVLNVRRESRSPISICPGFQLFKWNVKCRIRQQCRQTNLCSQFMQVIPGYRGVLAYSLRAS